MEQAVTALAEEKAEAALPKAYAAGFCSKLADATMETKPPPPERKRPWKSMEDDPLKKGWEEHVDLQTGKVWYYNKKLGTKVDQLPRPAPTAALMATWPTVSWVHEEGSQDAAKGVQVGRVRLLGSEDAFSKSFERFKE